MVYFFHYVQCQPLGDAGPSGNLKYIFTGGAAISIDTGSMFTTEGIAVGKVIGGSGA